MVGHAFIRFKGHIFMASLGFEFIGLVYESSLQVMFTTHVL